MAEHMQDAENPSAPTLPLSKEVEKEADFLLSELLKLQEAEYHNDLEPFSQHAEKVKLEAKTKLQKFYSEIQYAEELLKNEFNKIEAENQSVSFEVFEKAITRIQEKQNEQPFMKMIEEKDSMQDLLELPQEFMQHAFDYANSFFAQKEYYKAKCIYTFLRMIQTRVFAYCFGEALSLEALNQIDEAMKSYIYCIFLDPENPNLYFRIANCNLLLNEKACCLESLKLCMEYAKDNIEIGSQANELYEAVQNIR